MEKTREERLRAWARTFRGWLAITVILTALRVLCDLLFLAVLSGTRHRWPGSEQFIRDAASDLLGSACLAWALRYPARAWLVLIAADLLGTFPTAALLLGVMIAFHVEPPLSVVFGLVTVAPRAVSVLAVLWWVRRDARRAASLPT